MTAAASLGFSALGLMLGGATTIGLALLALAMIRTAQVSWSDHDDDWRHA
jgi:PIN domain nuclease of toxin-antitoxin system